MHDHRVRLRTQHRRLWRAERSRRACAAYRTL